MSPGHSPPPEASRPPPGEPIPSDEAALRELYEELRRLAAARMAGEAAGHTLQPTALVHEAWLRLAGADGLQSRWADRAHFFRVAALTMRRVLVDHARRHSTGKRGAGSDHLPFDGIDLPADAADQNARVVLIDEALSRLEQEDAEAARVVTLRFFGGFTHREIAAALEVAERTVERQWAYARARLMQLIQDAA